jgi:hypothetical protein
MSNLATVKPTVSIATAAKAALTKKTSKKSAAAKKQPVKVVEFGTVEVTVPTELNGKMETAKLTYNRYKKATKEWLPKLRTVGSALNELRSLYKSDREFGQEIAKTPLKVVSRQDRAELQWLDSHWEEIENLRNDGVITSYSIGVMLKQYRAFKKSTAEDTKPKGLTAKSTTSKAKSAPTSSMSEQRDGMASEKPQTTAKAVTAKALAQMVVDQLTKNGISVADFENELDKLMK